MFDADVNLHVKIRGINHKQLQEKKRQARRESWSQTTKGGWGHDIVNDDVMMTQLTLFMMDALAAFQDLSLGTLPPGASSTMTLC